MKRLYFLPICLCFIQMIQVQAQEISVTIPEGTAICIVINQDIRRTSEQSHIVASVKGDVYDASGKYIVIKNDAPADVRVDMSKRNMWDGDRGRTVLIPTNVETITGRSIALKEKWFTIEATTIRAGTPFTAYISQNTTLVIK